MDAIAREELHAFFGEPEKVASHFDNAARNLAEKEAELAAVERQITAVREEISRTHKLYLEEAVTVRGFGQFFKPAEERLNQFLPGLAKLQAGVACIIVSNVSAQEVVHEARTLYDRWRKLTNDQKRKIVESIFEKVVAGDDVVDINLSYLPFSEEMCKTMQQVAALAVPIGTQWQTLAEILPFDAGLPKPIRAVE